MSHINAGCSFSSGTFRPHCCLSLISCRYFRKSTAYRRCVSVNNIRRQCLIWYESPLGRLGQMFCCSFWRRFSQFAFCVIDRQLFARFRVGVVHVLGSVAFFFDLSRFIFRLTSFALPLVSTLVVFHSFQLWSYCSLFDLGRVAFVSTTISLHCPCPPKIVVAIPTSAKIIHFVETTLRSNPFSTKMFLVTAMLVVPTLLSREFRRPKTWLSRRSM